MKYTIPAVDQRAALALGDIDMTDCHLLGWLFTFCNSKSSKLERNKYGTWVNYEFLSADMPLLGLQRDAVGRRMRQLQDKGYLKLWTDKGMRRTYVDLTEKVERLFGDEPTNQSQRMPVSWPTNPDRLAHPRANESGSAHQSYYNHLHKGSGKLPVDKSSSSSPPNAKPASQATVERVRQQLAERGILRRRHNSSPTPIGAGIDTENGVKPGKQASALLRRGGRVQHEPTQQKSLELLATVVAG